MFEKLKRKFMLVIMTVITTSFALIFGSIYIITYRTNEKEMNMNLHAALNGPKRLAHESPFMAGMIKVEVDPKSSNINVYSLLDYDEEEIKGSILTIINSEDIVGRIEINNNSYGYLKEVSPLGIRMVLLDRQPQINVLNNLLKIFLIVGVMSLSLIYLISLYLTKKIIKPIKESYNKQKQFIGDASHELKTPLAIIKTNLSVILENKNEDVKSQMKWLNYISDQSDRMSNLIDEMLTLTKVDDIKEVVEIERFDLSDLLNNILLTCEAYIFENNINLNSDIKEEIFIKGDKENLKKTIIIILDNAIKYTNKNGSISVSLKEEKNKVKLEIKNTGEGIKKEHLEKIFERFYRVDQSRIRESGGYGLGLSIAKSIIDSHKGKIYAESNLGKDTTFIIELNKDILERLGEKYGR